MQFQRRSVPRRVHNLGYAVLTVAPLIACQGSAGQGCPAPSVAAADSGTGAEGGGGARRWPNEPAGFVTMTDWSYEQLVTRRNGKFAPGGDVWNQKPGTGTAAIVCDSS